MYDIPHGFDSMDCTPQQLRFFENMYRPGQWGRCIQLSDVSGQKHAISGL